MSVISERIRSAGEQLSSIRPSAIPGWMTTAGVGAWLIVGMAAALGLAGWFFSVTASISVPLVLAMVIGMIAYPVCARMTSRGVPKSAAAAIVLLLLLAVVVGVIWITVTGVLAQWPSVQAQLQSGIAKLGPTLNAMGFNSAAVDSAIQNAQPAPGASAPSGDPFTSNVLAALGSTLKGGLTGIFSLLFSVFIALMLVFYVLSDFPTMSAWVSQHMGNLPQSVGEGIIDDAVQAMRGYFKATSISGLAVAVIIGIAMVVMGVPLALTVALVTFLTCYIPFFGAIFSGAFAFVIALSSNGLPTAITLLVIVLLTQNVLQTIIINRVMGESLNLHPLVVLVVTMLGGIFGGLLGAALGAPLAALFINAGKRLAANIQAEAEQTP
jgi:predicted PurR-regulated permease PerM